MNFQNMQTFTGIEYLAIDVANAFGKQPSTGFRGDKELFQTRIDWVKANYSNLENMVDEVDEDPILFQKAVMSLKRACRGEEVGHIVYLDATCSGIQIMSALTGCIKGATITSLVNPNERADAYGAITNTINLVLQEKGLDNVVVTRPQAKDAIMPCTYGSQNKPKEYFGEGVQLDAFYEACHKDAPGAFMLLDILRDTWQRFAPMHSWVLPDGFVSINKVFKKCKKQVHIAELNNYNMTIETKEYQGTYNGVSNVANTIHSVDAYILREMLRRCSYNKNMVTKVYHIIKDHLESGEPQVPMVDEELENYFDLVQRHETVSVVILNHITSDNVAQLHPAYLKDLLALVEQMLSYAPFQVTTVHDAFGCHPNNCNVLRYWYRELLAELAESNVISCIIQQITFDPSFKLDKLSSRLSHLIRKSNYAIC